MTQETSIEEVERQEWKLIVKLKADLPEELQGSAEQIGKAVFQFIREREAISNEESQARLVKALAEPFGIVGGLPDTDPAPIFETVNKAICELTAAYLEWLGHEGEKVKEVCKLIAKLIGIASMKAEDIKPGAH